MKDLLPEQEITPNNSEQSMKNQQKKLKLRKFFAFAMLTAILLTIWSISRQNENYNSAQSKSKDIIERWRNRGQDLPSSKVEPRLSLGEKILIGADDSPEKQMAVKKFAAGIFQEAQIGFADSLKANPNDPEALIYLNNSLATFNIDAIKIGVSIPVGGNLNVAKEILRGVAQAQNEINKEGGVEQNGVKKLIQVQIANDDNEPNIAEQIAASFVADPKIMAVIGHNSSSASIAAAPIYQKGNLVMISPTSVARELSQAGDYIFRTTPSTRVLAETLSQYTVNDIRRQKVAVCYDSSSAASKSFKDEFSLSVFELGGEISNTKCDFASQEFDPNKIPTRAIADGSEAMLLVPSVDKINQALEIGRANQKRLVLLGNHSMYTYETLKVGQSDLSGMVIPTAWHPDSTANSAFNRNALDLWGKEGSWRTATAYDATKALIAGLSSGVTRKELQLTLSNPGFSASGVLSTVQFQGSGDRQIKGTLVKVEPGKGSGTGYDFRPVN